MSQIVVTCRKLSWRLSQIVVTYFFPVPPPAVPFWCSARNFWLRCGSSSNAAPSSTVHPLKRVPTFTLSGHDPDGLLEKIGFGPSARKRKPNRSRNENRKKKSRKIGNQGKFLFLGYIFPIFIPGPISGPIWFPISGWRPETYFLAGRLARKLTGHHSLFSVHVLFPQVFWCSFTGFFRKENAKTHTITRMCTIHYLRSQRMVHESLNHTLKWPILVGLRTQTQNAAFFERKGPERKPWPRGRSLNRKTWSQCVFWTLAF